MARQSNKSEATTEQDPESTGDSVTDEEHLPEADVVEEAPLERELTPEELIASLREECASLREKSLRAQADYQNQKRRAYTERDMEVRRRLQPLLSELLLVLDFLDMALGSPATQEETKNLAVGVDMTRTRLLQALENAGVHPITSEGIFDPELHEATGTELAEDTEPGTILSTSRRGYEWNGVVLRHAQVVVARDPEEAAAE